MTRACGAAAALFGNPPPLPGHQGNGSAPVAAGPCTEDS
jgi:hypothetical protein